MKSILNPAALSLAAFLASSVALANPSLETVTAVQKHWAQANYEAQGRQRKQAFKSLVEETDQMVASLPDSAEAHIWAGIVYSTYAGEVSMFKAGKQVKRARAELEKALEIDPEAMDGAAYTSLGALLYQIPGFMGGDDDLAEQMLVRGVELDQSGIDANYFYGMFLAEQDRDTEAEEFLRKAYDAAPRPGRELADAGRRKEITDALSDLGGAR
jgi:tetratricopeptide (TPR) repeat protein